MTRVRVRRLLLVACAFVAVACDRYGDEARTTVAVPSRDGFESVDVILEPHCGTLDCHGNPARNFRVYGAYGLRANGADVTGIPDTTVLDVDATYDAIVSLDPETLAAVFREHGQKPERFIVVAKARGLEHHTGGTRLPAGSDGDRCLVSWLAGKLDEERCNADVFGPLPLDGGTW
ncbi:MAG TPA: hypothetical protein VH062_31675 [Polyangiaceae bacterium]|jgi:hypothetical protein|nr:hypothetical protein [Polyangiaceae bacterium]